MQELSFETIAMYCYGISTNDQKKAVEEAIITDSNYFDIVAGINYIKRSENLSYADLIEYFEASKRRIFERVFPKKH